MIQLLNKLPICSSCNSNKTYIPNTGIAAWRIHKKTGRRYCKKCWNKLFDSENIKKGKRKYAQKILRFKGKQIALFKMRTGICSLCGHHGRTNLHHSNYLVIFPWFSTQELCVPCHNKQRIGMNYGKVIIG